MVTRKSVTAVPKIGIGNGEPLVHDVRLDRIYVHMSRLVKFPDGMNFATQLQDRLEGQPEQAVFIITSPHPRAGKKDSDGVIVYPSEHKLISVAAMPYTRWQEADREHRHYAGLADPLRPIFAGLLRQHLKKRHEIEALYA